MLLKDKVAIVTGSGGGIGRGRTARPSRGTAERFAREGARVVVTPEDIDELYPAEAVAHAERMMAAWRWPIVPRIRLATGFPLSGDPPARHFLRARRIGEIEDHHDVADIALGGR